MSIDRLAAAYREALAAWVGGVARRAWLVGALAVALSVAAVTHFVSAISINTSTNDMLSKDVPFRQYAREIDAAFPKQNNTLVVVIEGKTAGIADDAALAMGARLRATPAVFEDVFDLRGDPFLRTNGLLYMDTEALYDMSDRLAEAQPFLGTLWREPNLGGLFHMIGLAADEAAKADGQSPLPLNGVFGAIADVAEAQRAGRYAVLSWSALMEGNASGGKTPISERRRFLIVKPRLDFASLQPARDAIDAIRQFARDMQIDAAHGLRLRLTGSAAMEQEELASVEKGMGLAAALSLVLVLAIALFGLGSVRLVIATLATLIMGLVWTASFALLAVGALNLISVAFAVLFIGLSVDFGIHFGLRYREARASADDNAAALAAAAKGVGGPLTLCAFSAAISFFAFLPTDYVGLAELGLIAGGGMFIALFANLTVLPALLALLPVAPGGDDAVRSSGRPALGVKGARAICFGAVALSVACIALAPRAVFDFDPLNLRDPKTESVATLFDLMRDGAQNHYTGEILAADLQTAESLAARLSDLPEVDRAMTLASFIPAGQDEKLQIIADMALFLGPSLAVGTEDKSIDDAARLGAWSQLRGKLDRLASGGDAALAEQAGRMARALAAVFDGADKAAPGELEARLLRGLPGRLAALKSALNAGPVSADSLPDALRRRWVAADGRALIEVTPASDPRQRANLEAFVDAVRALAPRLSGAPVTVLEAGRTVIGAFVEAGVIAVLGICVLLFVVLGRLGDVALVFVPVFLAGLWTVAASVVAGLAFNLANVIVLPLLFGLGVAGAIHIVARARDAGGAASAMRTSTPRAVVLSALTTIGSFGSISLSSHPGTASMGLLLMIAISMTLAASLVFLPALMRVLASGRDG